MPCRAITYEEEEEKKQLIGTWKNTANHIINYRGEKLDFTPSNEVSEQIHQLLNQTNAAIDAQSLIHIAQLGMTVCIIREFDA